MPVPRQPDEAIFAPLRDLDVGGARVFLGLIHHDASLDDLRGRLRLATAHLAEFGIAGPCGYGRVDSRELPAVLRAHRQSLVELRRQRAQAAVTGSPPR
jgi:hypothetical protein